MASDDLLAGADAEQRRLMAEECIVIDRDDNVVGHDTKKNCHLNHNIEGTGLLHRAFSLFLFNSKNELLLQQRADSKITFASFWANTCCSHPLFMDSELPEEDGLGVKNAARRKIVQELGIPAEQVPLDCMEFMTRVHYGARSCETWGEHEIDWVIVAKPPKDVTLDLNPNEVKEARWFTKDELRTFVRDADKTGDLISPWFAIIEQAMLHRWWDALVEGRLASVKEQSRIYRADEIDAMAAAAGGGGGAAGASAGGAAARVGDASVKQGAYGKVVIHKHSLLQQLSHLDEVVAALRFKLGGGLASSGALTDADDKFCDDMLTRVSRSFAAVIRALPLELRMAVLIFYLVLRGLDTIEDDMTAFADDRDEKVHQLHTFYQRLSQDGWTMDGVGEGDERRLLQRYDSVIRSFNRLPVKYQTVIADICKRMGEGMAEFVAIDLGEGTTDVAAYDRYCYYVAGLVGEGLSGLFAASGLEKAAFGDAHLRTVLGVSMGRFLQKTNIIRDYLEDLVDGRAFWPADVWRKHARSLADLAAPRHQPQALACLNELITDALRHVPDCLDYLAELEHPDVFRFCAIPQVMAMATLHELYNNPLVFTGVVKIRRGLSARIVLSSTDIASVRGWFRFFARGIQRKIRSDDPNCAETAHRVKTVLHLTDGASLSPGSSLLSGYNLLLLPLLIFFAYVAQQQARERGSLLPAIALSSEMGMFVIFVGLLAYFVRLATGLAAKPKMD